MRHWKSSQLPREHNSIEAYIDASELFDKTSYGFLWESDLNLDRFSYVSPGASSLLGYPSTQWYSENGFWHLHTHPDDRDICLENLRSLGKDKVTTKIEHRMLRANGEPIWLETAAWLGETGEGTPALRGYSFDISSIMDKMDFFAALNRSLGEGVCALNEEGLVTYLNATGVWLLGWTHGGLIGKHIHVLGPISESALRGHIVSSQPLTFTRKNGTQFPVLYSANPIRRAGGKIIGTVIAFRDITKICQTEARLKQTNRELEALVSVHSKNIEALKMERHLREQFVATLSHDLRNPLATAVMSSSLLRRLPKSDRSFEMLLSRIERSLGRADRMIRNLLDVHLIEAGTPLPLHVEVFDVVKMATGLVEDLELVHGHRILCSFEPSTIQVQWCRDSVWRMLENLLNNAFKYGDRDKSPRLTLHKPSDSSMVSIVVKNDGPPIRELNAIFDPFFREQSARTSREQGWGLGLSVVKGIVDSHCGTIQVESSRETGTVFTIEIPESVTASSI